MNTLKCLPNKILFIKGGVFLVETMQVLYMNLYFCFRF